MSLQEKQIKLEAKPAIYTIIAVFILFFVSLMLQHSENPFVNFIANLYLFPYHLEFSKTFSVFIAAIISSVIAIFTYGFGYGLWDSKNKIPLLYCWNDFYVCCLYRGMVFC